MGLEVCRELANELSDRHGVQILIGEDAAQIHPWDYTFTAEHHVDVFRRALSRLDEMLSLYPAGMLGSAVTEMGDGTLRICLVRSIEGIADSNSLGSASGVQFWDESTGNTYVVLKIADDMEQHLHHELFHVIESRIFSLSKALDDWEKLNPNGFRYDYSYLHFTTREDHHLIEGETQAFIDLYAMTFPKEDRARVMEYAITEGHETSFTTNIMQAKLRAICVGIRQAYGLKDLAETYLWEQYLDQPIRAKEIK